MMLINMTVSTVSIHRIEVRAAVHTEQMITECYLADFLN